ncbi:MAG: hypothetical protein NTU63_01995 [Candidatus Pacearchaeota archaeon]|nr:hypothetical protein [Candidatus Pacearchaeota archaeon]
MTEVKYKDFCKESGCRLYGLLTKVNSFENPSPLVIVQKEVIERRCKENCEHTAHELYEWLKSRRTID